ncbi:MAG: hypothetical protein HC772_15130 [Leptolyngbyaceae cyanobacterium CRU_2_3]|nr:hypothetical protein [Leptolyngbyaceae cyanobacterium CRU_2_3]
MGFDTQPSHSIPHITMFLYHSVSLCIALYRSVMESINQGRSHGKLA